LIDSNPKPLTSVKLSPLGHIRELDGLRGIAVLLVVFHHLTLDPGMSNGSPIQVVAHRIFQYGNAGVDVFFVLSGFLISSLLIRDRQSPAYYQDFYWKRILRIFPLYFLILFLILIFVRGSGTYVVLAAFFVANFASVFHIDQSTVFWSLAVEEQFYLLWPTVVRKLTPRRLAQCAVAIAATSVVLRFVAARLGHHNYYLTFLHCDGLAAGALLACLFAKRERDQLSPDTHDRSMWWAAGIALPLLLLALLLPQNTNREEALAAAILLTGITLFCFAFVGLLISHSGRQGIAAFRSPVLIFFGQISYALYLVHTYVMDAFDKWIGRPAAGDTSMFLIRAACTLIGGVLLSLLTRYLIELPALSLRSRVLSRPAPKAETQLPL